MLKPLPVSTYTFSDIINGGYLYIDKTQYIYSLIREPKGVYFLSRPRRFGKSLTISTLEEIFLGHIFLMIGAQAAVEVKTNRGRIDTVIELSDHIFLFEFKLSGAAKTALQQIKNNAYAQKYALKGKAITLIGVTFNSKQRRVGEGRIEPFTP